ncbi:MAG: hypothetical protein M3550_04745 [Actinomycetota bacterium]|nr:hypothetical protein [Actinomycetota bacterium]
MKPGRAQVDMIALYEELGSYRAVAAIVGCDHKTVKRYVELAGEQGQLAPVRHRARITDSFNALIRERIQSTEGKITARRLCRTRKEPGGWSWAQGDNRAHLTGSTRKPRDA